MLNHELTVGNLSERGAQLKEVVSQHSARATIELTRRRVMQRLERLALGVLPGTETLNVLGILLSPFIHVEGSTDMGLGLQAFQVRKSLGVGIRLGSTLRGSNPPHRHQCCFHALRMSRKCLWSML